MKAKLAAKWNAFTTVVAAVAGLPDTIDTIHNRIDATDATVKDEIRDLARDIDDRPTERDMDERIENALEDAFNDRNFDRAIKDTLEDVLPDAMHETIDAEMVGNVMDEVDLTEHEAVEKLNDRLDDLEAENEELKTAVAALTAVVMRLAADANWDVDDVAIKTLTKATEDM